ncbi:MAG: hypothetical protein LBT66_04135 [Methanobrevibacter sp.]|nr:hypothetical protein [Candidatus Methanovirga meridionalis]
MLKLKGILLIVCILLCIGTVNAVESGNVHIVEKLNGGDQDFSYVINAIIAGSPNWVRFDSGSGNVDKNVPLPYTITQLAIYGTGTTTYRFFGTHKSWWKNHRSEINFDISNHTTRNIKIEFGSEHHSTNYNKPYVKIDGETGVFNHGVNGYGYGWFWDISYW